MIEYVEIAELTGKRHDHVMGDIEGMLSEHCRLTQGDKTHYDGKGQPVPDGVTIKLFWKQGVSEFSRKAWSQTVDWTGEDKYTHYQVQESGYYKGGL